MGKGKQGDWKRAAQDVAEARAQRLARGVWVAYWRSVDKQRRASKLKLRR